MASRSSEVSGDIDITVTKKQRNRDRKISSKTREIRQTAYFLAIRKGGEKKTVKSYFYVRRIQVVGGKSINGGKAIDGLLERST